MMVIGLLGDWDMPWRDHPMTGPRNVARGFCKHGWFLSPKDRVVAPLSNDFQMA